MHDEWIKLRNLLWDDPRIVALAVALGEHLPNPACPSSGLFHLEFLKCVVLGALSRMWSLADQYTLDGTLPHYTPTVLNDVLGMEGLFDFAGALMEMDWLRFLDGRLIIPRFSKHNGRSAKARHQNTLRQQKRRASVAPVSRSGSGAVATKARPQKEKENKKKQPKKVASAAPADGAASQPEKEPEAGAKKGTPNPVWDALCEVFGLKPVTEAERKRVGRIVRDLKAKEARPEEITQRLARYRQEWPNAAATPEALLKHWDAFGPAQTAAGTETPAQRDARILAQRQRAEQERQAAAKGLSFSDLSKEAGDASQ